MQFLSKYQYHSSPKNKKNNPKIHMKAQEMVNNQSNPKQKNKAGSITILDFKTY